MPNVACSTSKRPRHLERPKSGREREQPEPPEPPIDCRPIAGAIVFDDAEPSIVTLAASGIESSYDRDRRKTAQRRLEMLRAETATPIPGIEVTYLELDPSLWDQFTVV